MQFNQTYIPDEASVQVNKPMEQIYNNQVLLQNCLPFPDCPASWDTLLHRQSMEEFEQQTKETMNNLYSKRHRSSGMSLTNRRDLNRERERKRQTRLKKAFNVLRNVIPDYFSKREPGDRLSRIQTLKLRQRSTSLHYMNC